MHKPKFSKRLSELPRKNAKESKITVHGDIFGLRFVRFLATIFKVWLFFIMRD